MIYLFFLYLLAIFMVEWVDATETIRNWFTSRSTNNPNVYMRFVTNSGVCETTPGVQQMSGYIDVGKGMSMVSISIELNIVGQSPIWASVVLVL